jgi:hypothetical protein
MTLSYSPVHDAHLPSTATTGLFAIILPAKGFGLDLGKLPESLTNRLLVAKEEIVAPVTPVRQTIAALVYMGEEEIVGTGARIRLYNFVLVCI